MENTIRVVLRRSGLDLCHAGIAIALERRLAAISVVKVDEGVVGVACYRGGFDVADGLLTFAIEEAVLLGALPSEVELPYWMNDISQVQKDNVGDMVRNRLKQAPY